MKGLVDKAKPFAEALILDKPVKLDRKAQSHLTGWIAIATIMAEFTDRDTAVIPAHDRTFLFDRRVPPKNWTIMLGRYAGTEWEKMRYEHHVTGFSPRPPANSNVTPDALQVTTYTLGGLVVHAFTVPRTSLVSAGRLFVKSHDLMPLWPPYFDNITWPGSPTLGDTELRDIASGFSSLVTPPPWDL